MCYSTCSLNPLENEAVVAELLRQSQGTLRIVDVSDKLEGLKRCSGLRDWVVAAGSEDSVYESVQDALTQGRSEVCSSMFRPTPQEAEWMQLERCVRIWPHLQNTGGFFVCVLEKSEHPDSKASPPAKRHKLQEPQDLAADVLDALPKDEVVKERELPHNMVEEPYKQLVGDKLQNGKSIVECIREFYDLQPNFPLNQLFGRSEECNRISLVSSGIVEVLNGGSVRAISSGCHVFGRSNFQRSARSCDFRLMQDGVQLVGPYMRARAVHLTNPHEFCELAMHKAVDISCMRNTDTRSALEALDAGSIAISCCSPSGKQVWAVGEKTGKCLQLFVAKEELEQLVSMVAPGTPFVWQAGTQKQISINNEESNA